MSDILSKHFVLKLNKFWKPVGTPTVYDAIVAMCREPTFENGFSRPYYALDIDYPQVNWPPVEWDDWVNLPLRPQDNYIQAALKRIRVPTVIIANNYNGVPKKTVKYSKAAVRRRDGNKCQYSGEQVDGKTGDIDHVMPLDLGGKTEWGNVVTAKKEINRLKRNMHPEEFFKKYPQFMKPRPFQPKAKVVEIINTYGIQDWDLFLK